VALAFLGLWAFIWSGDFPAAIDFWGHLAKAEYLAGEVATQGIRAFFNTTWYPDWYLGDAFLTYYPPLTTFVLTPFVLLFRAPGLIHKAFTTLALAMYGGGVYWFVRATWGRWPAALGTVLAVWAPYQLRTLFFEGNYPRMLALLALPVIALATERLLGENRRKMPTVVLLAGAWAWAILAHPQQAAIFAVGMAMFVIARLFLEPEVPFRWAIYVLAGLVGGAGLSAPWSLPAYSYGEHPHVPFLPLEKIDLFSAPVTALIPNWNSSSGVITVGLGVLVLVLLSLMSRPERRRSAWAIAGLVSIWLASGPAGVLFSLLPMHNALMPERFLNFAGFALAVAAAGLLPMLRRAVVARAILIAVLFAVDAVPSLSILQGRAFPQREAALGVVAPEDDQPGRTLLLTYPEPSASEIYFAGKQNELVNGWALENTPHHKSIRRYLGAMAWGSDYVAHLMGIWDVNQVVIQANGNEVELTHSLVSAGFSPDVNIGDYAVWTRAEPFGPVQGLPSRRMLVLGDGITHLLAAFPFAEEALEESLLAFPEEAFARYPAAAMSHFIGPADSMAAVEARARDYVEAGGTLIVDLSGMEETFASTLDFLDVRVLRIQVSDVINLRWDEALGDMPESLALDAAGMDQWSGAVYGDLDRVFAEVELDGEWFPVLGYRDIGEGRVWFVGMNLLYYGQAANASELLSLADELMLADVELARDLQYNILDVTAWAETGQGVYFEYQAAEVIPEALISYTYSPRWELRIDDVPVSFERFENLILTSLPAGSHTVELVYRRYGTGYPVAGFVIGVLAAVALGGGLLLERSRGEPQLEEQAPGQEEEPREYAVCANCSFRFAEIGPPTAVTYPFQVVHCPICGLRMDDEGFEPGRTLSEGDRKHALDDWLSANRYSPDIVHERWGFEAEEFFSEQPRDESAGYDDPLNNLSPSR